MHSPIPLTSQNSLSSEAQWLNYLVRDHHFMDQGSLVVKVIVYQGVLTSKSSVLDEGEPAPHTCQLIEEKVRKLHNLPTLKPRSQVTW